MSFRTFVTESRAATLTANARLRPIKMPWQGGSQVRHHHSIWDGTARTPKLPALVCNPSQHMHHTQVDELNYLSMQQDFLRARKDEAATQAQLKQ